MTWQLWPHLSQTILLSEALADVSSIACLWQKMHAATYRRVPAVKRSSRKSSLHTIQQGK